VNMCATNDGYLFHINVRLPAAEKRSSATRPHSASRE
jgi:hypothetical protein